MTTAAVEEYLAVAFRLQEEGAAVTVATLAQRLSLSHASVSLMVKRLVQEELLGRQDGELRLTAEGERRAAEVVRRHRLAERFLFDVLGLAWDDVHDEAGRWEHVLSPAVEERLDGVVGRPESCPHGHPIPGREAALPVELHALSSLEAGEKAVVVQVRREETTLLRYLASLGLLPGARVLVEQVAPFGGPLLVRLGSARYALGRDMAGQILVRKGAR
jgi:DtxR family Mn-dependent transcriptional regulator